jgi:glycine oxidase
MMGTKTGTNNSASARPKILVIGGGLMGLWPAALLARHGYQVTVLEQNTAAIGASWAAAGMLSPASEAGEEQSDTPLLARFGAHSLGLWQDWSATFENAGHSVCWRPFGALLTAFDEPGLQRLQRTFAAANALDLHPEHLNPADARALEPALSPGLLGALKVNREASVEPRLVLLALQAMLRSAGGNVVFERQAIAVEPIRHALQVSCANGQKFYADKVILASGFSDAAIAGNHDLHQYLQPVKGQMLSLLVPDNPARSVLRDAHTYLVPRGDGRMIIGASSEPGRSDTQTHKADIDRLHARAATVLPVLKTAKRAGSWAGIRPQSVDGLPLIGPLETPGLYVNCGHHRNGVLQAPASAQMLTALMLEQDAGPFSSAFLPDRFAFR